MQYCKEMNFDNVKEKLSKEVKPETFQDIEDFLLPKFDTQFPDGKKRWRIVQDGHGRWREINIGGQHKVARKCHIPCKISPSHEATKTLCFSNNILNTVKSASKLASGRSSRQDSNYKTLSTNTRANIFPGVGKHQWLSQSNNVYTQSALMLSGQSGHDLQDEFYGVTRDALGAWNEASVHHERMKKAWDVYLELLAKSGGGR
jgi:hypothetical protein